MSARMVASDDGLRSVVLPTLGDRVIYTRQEGKEYAAIVAATRSDSMRVRLAVFMYDAPASGVGQPGNAELIEGKVWFTHWLGYDAHRASNTWHWRPDGLR